MSLGDTFQEIKAKLAEQNELLADMKGTVGKVDALEKAQAEDRERIEELEARGGSPGRPGTAGGAPVRHKTHHVGDAKVYELPADVKLADVVPAKAAPVSFERWLAAAMAGEHCKDREALEFAREQKQLVTTTTGMLIPESYQAQWVDRIRAQMVLNAAGMTTVTMENKILNSSRVATDPAATWHTEAASITANNPTFVAQALTAHTLVTRCTGSVEVSQDSPDFGAQLARVMAAAMAVELDRVGLIGTGTPPEPHGILDTSGTGSVAAVGTVTDYSELLAGVRLLLEANIPLDVATRVAIMSPAVWAAYEGLATGISSDKTQLPRPRALEAMRFLVTSNGLDVDNSPPTTANSTLFLGDFRDLVLGVRREASVEALKLQSFADNLILEFVGYLRADFLVRRPASFCTLEGITVSS